MTDIRAPDCLAPQWHELSDIVRQVVQNYDSNTDMLSADRVAKCWRSLDVPYPQEIRMQHLTKLQIDWLQRNHGRISSLNLGSADSMQTSSAFEPMLEQCLMALGGPRAMLQQLTIKQGSKVFNTSSQWTMPAGLEALTLLRKLHLNCSSMMAMPVTAFAGLTNLAELQLQSQCLLALPNMEHLVHLRRLHIKDCHKLAKIDEVSDLTALEELELGPCEQLAAVPCIGKFSNTLQRLALTCLPSIASWPLSLQQLHKMHVVELDQMPVSIPGDSRTLTSLTRLVMNSSVGFGAFLVDPGALQSLHSLDLKYVIVPELPAHMERLTALTELALVEVHQLRCLPHDTARLPKLQQLVIQHCPNLVRLSERLPQSLTKIAITDCLELQLAETNFHGLHNLRQLHIKKSTTQEFMLPESIRGRSALTQLVIKDCAALVTLPRALSNMSALLELSIINCSNLSCLPAGFGSGNSSLSKLILSECSNLQPLPDSLAGATVLKELELSGLHNNRFNCLPDLAAFTALTSLIIRKCTKVKYWPDSLSALIMTDQLEQLTLASSPFITADDLPEPVLERLRHFSVYFQTPKVPQNKTKSCKELPPIEGQPMFPPLASAGLSPIKTPRSNPFGGAKPVDTSPEKYFASRSRMHSTGGFDSPTAGGHAAGSPSAAGTSANCHSPSRNPGSGHNTAGEASSSAAASSPAAAAAAGPAAQPGTPTRRNPFGDAKPVDCSLEKYFARSRATSSASGCASPSANAVADQLGAALRISGGVDGGGSSSNAGAGSSSAETGNSSNTNTGTSSDANAGSSSIPDEGSSSKAQAGSSSKAAGRAGMADISGKNDGQGVVVERRSIGNPWMPTGPEDNFVFNPDGW